VIPAIGGRKRRALKAASNGSTQTEAGLSLNASTIFNSDRLLALDSRSSVAEAYRVLRTSVLLSSTEKPPKTVLITSGQPGEGKTKTAVNTAISLAQLGSSVLIVDCLLTGTQTFLDKS
jgi:Mrp family chromosome partitioning ATPase